MMRRLITGTLAWPMLWLLMVSTGSTELVQYWPLDDGNGATATSGVVGGNDG